MLISFGYDVGENKKYKYFENFKALESFIFKYLEVNQSEFNYFDLSVYTGKEEERVRKLNDVNVATGEGGKDE